MIKTLVPNPKDAELAALIDDAEKIALQTKSVNTKRAYRSDLKLFVAWCDEHNLDSLPATNDAVALYMVYMDKIGRRPSTIRRALTSINQAHVLAGHPEPVDARVLELKKGIHRIRGRARKKKIAITLERLRRFIITTPNDFIGTRDRALLLVGWTAALRRSELCAILHEDLEERPEGFALTLPRSKTDQEGVGRKIGLPFVDGEPTLCAVRALRKWLKLAKIESGPVFRIIGRSGYNKMFHIAGEKSISDKRVSLIIKSAARRAGYESAEYSGHSLRSGLVTTLAHAGISETGIMGITGHKTSEMLREYIHEGQLFQDHPITSLFSCRD
jgi:site-specific recombinase XerD